MTSEIHLTPSGHAWDCEWHIDQYPWECTCGFLPSKKAMDDLIAQDADLIEHRAQPKAAPVEPLCPFTDRPAWECAAACTCAHFKPTAIIGHAHPPAAPVEPVAWLYTDEEGGRVACVEQIEPPFEGWTETPLYTRAALAAMQEAKQ